MNEANEQKSGDSVPFKNMTWANLASFVAVMLSLATAVVACCNFAVRIDRLEQTDKAHDTAISRHDNLLNSVPAIDTRLARIEARLDMLVEQRNEGGKR